MLCMHYLFVLRFWRRSEGVPGNTISRIKFYTELGYYVGPHFYSLNDIEHGLLRGKSPGISFLMCSGNGVNPVTGAPQFDKGDPRLAFICELDPRIHFALVCGAKSCPPIRIFTEGIILPFGFCNSAQKILKKPWKWLAALFVQTISPWLTLTLFRCLRYLNGTPLPPASAC